MKPKRGKVTVSTSIAALGGHVQFSVDGRKLKLKIPANTQPGTTLRLKGQGGWDESAQEDRDLLVEVIVGDTKGIGPLNRVWILLSGHKWKNSQIGLPALFVVGGIILAALISLPENETDIEFSEPRSSLDQPADPHQLSDDTTAGNISYQTEENLKAPERKLNEKPPQLAISEPRSSSERPPPAHTDQLSGNSTVENIDYQPAETLTVKPDPSLNEKSTQLSKEQSSAAFPKASEALALFPCGVHPKLESSDLCFRKTFPQRARRNKTEVDAIAAIDNGERLAHLFTLGANQLNHEQSVRLGRIVEADHISDERLSVYLSRGSEDPGFSLSVNRLGRLWMTSCSWKGPNGSLMCVEALPTKD